MHRILTKFLSDRGTHLAAMIAYFALLSFVPLLFLALSLTALLGQQNESSYLVEELRRAFPASSVDRLVDVVRSIQDQATSIGIIGGIALLWGALGFFSVLESAFNIVYGLPNRSFVHQKVLVLFLVAGSLAVLFVALVVGSLGVDLIHNAGVAGGVLSYVYALAVSTTLIFGLLRVTNLAHGASLIFQSECQVHYVMEAIHDTLAGGHTTIEVKPEVHDEYAARYSSEIAQMVWAHPSVEHSHFKNKDGKIFTLSPWPIPTYWRWTHAVDANDYTFG